MIGAAGDSHSGSAEPPVRDRQMDSACDSGNGIASKPVRFGPRYGRTQSGLPSPEARDDTAAAVKGKARMTAAAASQHVIIGPRL